MKYLILLSLIFCISCEECGKFSEDCERLNLLSKPLLLSLSSDALFVEASIIDNSGKINDFGFTWSTAPLPAIEKGSSRTPPQDSFQDIEDFRLLIRDLSPGETYYVRAFLFINNVLSPFYSEQNAYTTIDPLSIPTSPIRLQTGAVSQITTNQAIVKGSLDNDNRLTVEEYGFCWSTINLLPTLDQDEHQAINSNAPFLFGDFSDTIQNLAPQSRYFVRAYVRIEGIPEVIYHLGNTEFVTQSN